MAQAVALPTTSVPLEELRPHPRNYRAHPPDQIEHLIASLRRHGPYRNVVVARDGTILAGHGVVQAARADGWTELPVVRVDVDPDDPVALQILAGDNEVARLAEIDDRALTELLAELQAEDLLLSTGFDEAMLANLIYVTRPASEIADLDAAAEWIGLPDFEVEGRPYQCLISFETEADRDRFVEQLGVYVRRKMGRLWSLWWPERERQDNASLRFDE